MFNYRVSPDYLRVFHIIKFSYLSSFLRAGQFWFPKPTDPQGFVGRAGPFSVYLRLWTPWPWISSSTCLQNNDTLQDVKRVYKVIWKVPETQCAHYMVAITTNRMLESMEAKSTTFPPRTETLSFIYTNCVSWTPKLYFEGWYGPCCQEGYNLCLESTRKMHFIPNDLRAQRQIPGGSS